MADAMETSKLERLLSECTPGPWEWIEERSYGGGSWRLGPGVMWPDTSDATPGGDKIDRANAALIALAPTLAKQALAAKKMAEALRKSKEALERAMQTIGDLGEAFGEEGPSRDEAAAFLAARDAESALAEWEASQ